MSEQITLFLFFAATIASVFFVCICSLRQYCNSFCCHKLFHRGRRGSPESRNSEQYNVDRVLAESLQRRLNEEERERERAAKRKERRMWYEYYMKPYTMVSGRYKEFDGTLRLFFCEIMTPNRCIFQFSLTLIPSFLTT